MNLVFAICMLFFIYQALSHDCPQYDQARPSDSPCNCSGTADNNEEQQQEEEEAVAVAEDVNNHLSYPQCRQTYITSKMVVSPFKEVENKVPPKSYSSVCIKCAACLAVAEKFEEAFKKVSALRKGKKHIEDYVDDQETPSDEHFDENESYEREIGLKRLRQKNGDRIIGSKTGKRRCPTFDDNHENEELDNFTQREAESNASWYDQLLYSDDNKADPDEASDETESTMPYSYPEIEDTLKQELSNVCSRSFRNYDLRQNAGVQFLTNNFFNTTHVPSTMDGKWCGKLRAICVMFANHADLQYLYYKYLNATAAVDMKEYLCQNVGIFKDCVNVEFEKCYIGKHQVFGDHFISCDNPECKTCEDRSCLML